MSDEPLTPEEIRNWRHEDFGRGCTRSFLTVPLMIVTLVIGSPLLEKAGIWCGLPANVMHAVARPLLIILTTNVFSWLWYRKQDSHEIIRQRLLRQRMDQYQTQWRLGIIAAVMAAAWFAFDLSTHIDKFLRDPGKDSLPFLYAAVIVSAAVMACHGPRKALNDELTKALRRQSVMAGYFCLMFLLCGSFAVILFRPDLAVTILLWLMFAGAAIPLLGYTFLEWRAGRVDG